MARLDDMKGEEYQQFRAEMTDKVAGGIVLEKAWVLCVCDYRYILLVPGECFVIDLHADWITIVVIAAIIMTLQQTHLSTQSINCITQSIRRHWLKSVVSKRLVYPTICAIV
jgi:hypothetical protein